MNDWVVTAESHHLHPTKFNQLESITQFRVIMVTDTQTLRWSLF